VARVGPPDLGPLTRIVDPLVLSLILAIVLVPVAAIGVLLAFLGLPGVWLLLGAAIAAQWATNATMFAWWTLGVGVAVALLGELGEFLGGAATSRATGGSRRSAIGAIVGGIIGAVLGAGFPPVIGAIIWSIVGAGIGAVIGELSSGRPWRESLPLGPAAARGRFYGALAKGTACTIVAVLVLVAAFVP